MHTRKSLTQDLKSLGVQPGDLLFIHSSFKSIGEVDGGAGAVVAALEDAVGEEGLILMPSFNLVEHELRAKVWDRATSPSTVGWLTEFFRSMPGTVRSDHYSHSVAARGRGARQIVADHLSREGVKSQWDQKPWGNTYGDNSPMNRACQYGGKLLMLGVAYDSSTYVHFVESLMWTRRLETDPEAAFVSLDRDKLGAWWDDQGRMTRGNIGGAASRLFLIRDYVDSLMARAENDLAQYEL